MRIVLSGVSAPKPLFRKKFIKLRFSFTEELTDLVQQIHPKMLITTYENLLDIFQSTLKEVKMDTDCPIYVYENTYPGCHDLKPLLENYFTSFEDFEPAGVNDAAKDTLILILSSATTGKPKLINCTHKQMLMQLLVFL